jgi:myo-inositol-1(or 4)-monophosphatase
MPEVTPDSTIDHNFLRSCLVDAGKIALSQRGQMSAMVKADQTPVTEVDRQVESFLIDRIQARYPEHTILSEESGLHPSQETYAWIIDPIDGTRSFASGLPIWGVSIGILKGGAPVVGGFYLPVTGEMYWGTPQQAYYNDQPMVKIEKVDLHSPLVFLGVPSSVHRHFEINFPVIRSLGSTAAQMAYVATGAAVGALTYAVSLWDLAGVLPVLMAAGIEITDLNGRPFQPAELMDGEKAPMPLLAAHPSVAEYLRTHIHLK